jgi:glycosyltransferase involved in cell wall biosynthesis
MRKAEASPRSIRRKIAWLSPFGPRSDVGAHSAAILRALDRRASQYHCELVLFVQPNGSTYPTDAPRVMMGPNFPSEILSLFDVVTLNIGNNHGNHAHINEYALAHGGLVVVHDIVMQHYFAWKYFDSLKLPGRYADLLCRYYGPDAIEVLNRSSVTLQNQAKRYLPWDSEHAFACPLIEPFLEKAKAVVVHSRFASEVVGNFTNAPQLQLFLPFDKKPPPSQFQAAPDGKIRFSVTGHINRAKHVHLCIDAFAGSDRLKSLATLRVAGGASDLDYIRELMDLVRENGLHDHVKFEFDITERRLLEIKGATDVFVNVRFPNTESASGSLAEQMACGVPSILFDSGCYREIPEGAALKIRDLSTPAALRAAMEALATDPASRQRIGRAAIDYGKSRTADDYAGKFLDFVVERDFRAAPTAIASGLDFAPFPWLKRRLDALEIIDNPPPTLFHPKSIPNFRSIADLDPFSLARYLSFGLFRQSVPDETLESVHEVVARTSRSQIPQLLGRLSFFLRVCEKPRPIGLSEASFALEVEALAILYLFDRRKFATVLFLSLLGRAPQTSEVEPVLAAHVSPGNLLRALANTGEFVSRLASAELIERLQKIAARLDAPQRPYAQRWPLLDPGVMLSRDQLGQVMGEGWDEIQAEGAWSRRTSAVLRFRMDPERQRDGAAVQLDLRARKPSASKPQVLRLVLNGVEIAEIPIETEDRFIVEIPLDEMQGNEAELALNVAHLVRPAAYDPLGDMRALGVFLHGMKLTQTPAQ